MTTREEVVPEGNLLFLASRQRAGRTRLVQMQYSRTGGASISLRSKYAISPEDSSAEDMLLFWLLLIPEKVD